MHDCTLLPSREQTDRPGWPLRLSRLCGGSGHRPPLHSQGLAPTGTLVPPSTHSTAHCLAPPWVGHCARHQGDHGSADDSDGHEEDAWRWPRSSRPQVSCTGSRRHHSHEGVIRLQEKASGGVLKSPQVVDEELRHTAVPWGSRAPQPPLEVGTQAWRRRGGAVAHPSPARSPHASTAAAGSVCKRELASFLSRAGSPFN